MKTLEKDFNTCKKKLDKLEYSDFLPPFEPLYSDIQNLEVTDQWKQLLKARIEDSPLSSFNSYNKNSAPLNLFYGRICVLKITVQK